MRWFGVGVVVALAGCVQGEEPPKRVLVFQVNNPGWCGECTDNVEITWSVEPADPPVSDLKVAVELGGEVVHTITGQMGGTVTVPEICGNAEGEGKSGQVTISGTGIPETDPLPLQQTLTGEIKRLDFEPVCTDGTATSWADETGYTENLYPVTVRISRLRNATYYDLNNNDNFDGSPPDQQVPISVGHPPNLPAIPITGGSWSSIPPAQNTLHGMWTASPTAGSPAPGTRCPPDDTNAEATLTLVALAEVACVSE